MQKKLNYHSIVGSMFRRMKNSSNEKMPTISLNHYKILMDVYLYKLFSFNFNLLQSGRK